MVKPFSAFKRFDWILFLAIILLLSLGLIIQYNLSARSGGPSPSDFAKQFLFSGIGLVLFFSLSFFDYRALKNLAYLLYPLALLLLVAVLILGKTVRGTTGWIPLGIFNFQAVEMVKVLLIIVLAKFWANRAQGDVRFRDVVWSGLLISLPAGLVLLQPDWGSAAIIFGLGLVMLMMANRKLSHIFIILTLIAAVICISWLFFLKDYQQDRIMTFLNPQRDPLGRGYQVTQSIVAVGSGQILGRGLGLGPQSQLNFLPAAETDFVFAVIAEELGLAGSLLALGLFALLFYRMAKISQGSFDNFSLFMILGVSGVIFIQLTVNVGMNIGLAPIMGIPLPLVSYGGSSLLTTLMALGIVESVSVRRVKSSFQSQIDRNF